MKKGSKMSEESKEKMRVNHKGMIGRKHSKEAKEKMRLSIQGSEHGFKKGQKPWNTGKKGVQPPPWNKGTKGLLKGYWEGKKRSEETKRKLSEANKDRRLSPKTEFKKGSTSGEKNVNWKGGVSKQKGYRTMIGRKRRARKKNALGGHTAGDWETLKAQYNWTCPACGKIEPEIKLTEDHVIPLSKGGSDNIENIQPLCVSCNSKKHTKVIRYDCERSLADI